MQDEKLQGNEKIEAAIEGLKKELTQDMLAHTLTVIRRRMKEADKVMSAFMGNMRQLFEAVLKTEEVKGIIVNPWNRTVMLDKNLIRIILGMTA